MEVDVLIEIKVGKDDKTFRYLVPNKYLEEVKVGKRVLVPFGLRQVEGFILNISDDVTTEFELKEIIGVLDKEPVLNEELLELGNYLAKKTLSPLIYSYQAMLPKALKAKKKVNINKKYETYLFIAQEISEDMLSSDQQVKVIELIRQGEYVLKKDARKISESAVDTLLKKGIIAEKKAESYRLKSKDVEINKRHKLNQEQQVAFEQVRSCLGVNMPFLMHGVTGSGKTEVYMHIIEEVLKQEKEAIVLVPEISLTPQMVETFKGRFGDQVAVIHSRLSVGEKYDEWRKIVRREVSIVIGARSAIFAPFNNLGIIIIDEEHSTTYKQENTPRYNAIDVGLRRSKSHNCSILLGSATPSIESYTRAKMGIYQLLELKKRVNDNFPLVKLVDMRLEIKRGRRILSKELIDNMNLVLSKGEQVLILLNRRGYTTVLSCQNCGSTVKCPNCDIPLIYHKVTNDLRCHYCDYVISKINKCPHCQNEGLRQYGFGTQKLEEEIKTIFKDANVIRMDIDTTTRKGSHERIIREFKQGKYNILIGTQMIAKGLDFEKVTLVGVLNGDATLNIPDFRSSERTFQLLNQVSGRAGRGDYLGKVIIQTFNLDHYSITMAVANKYQEFYDNELKIRNQLGYPPFYNLTTIKISSKDYELGLIEATKINEYLKSQINNNDIFLLGPSMANMPKINNVYYLQIIIKYKRTKDVFPLFKEVKNIYHNNSKVYVDIDVNPLRI